jgi:catechol 2,3-dioxygenase-like lactoylglutathione lyase family enzyme
MNRFHVHVHVVDLDANIAFYSQLFGAQPTVRKPDYAKWMLEDPRINFAISNPHDGKAPGVAHLGIQAETTAALEAIGDRLKAADAVALAEAGTTCCYAQSDKYWAQDPQGLQWESFHTHGEATTYFAPASGKAVDAAACCAPMQAVDAAATTVGACGASSCGVPADKQVVAPNASACCG